MPGSNPAADLSVVTNSRLLKHNSVGTFDCRTDPLAPEATRRTNRLVKFDI
jgi:hypothetical protein